MYIIDNIITLEEIHQLKEVWKRVQEREYINFQHTDGRIVDHRYPLDQDNEGWKLIQKIVRKNFKKPQNIWSALQRQTNPHSLHIDDYLCENLGINDVYNTWTYVIPLDTIPEFRVIVWKDRAVSNVEMVKMFPNYTEKLSNISEQEDIDHIPVLGGTNIGDMLELDGVYSYKAGSGVLFGAKQFHSTNNWKKYPQFSYRELLQIHVYSDLAPEVN